MGFLILSICVIVLGFILMKYPPKSRNNMHGHKSHLAKKNKDTWDVTQKHSGFSMIIIGVINGIFGIWSIIQPMAINDTSMQLSFWLISIIVSIIVRQTIE